MPTIAVGDLYKLTLGSFAVIEVVSGTNTAGAAPIVTPSVTATIEIQSGTPLFGEDLEVFVLQGQGDLSSYYCCGTYHASWGREHLSAPTVLPHAAVIPTAWAPGTISGTAGHVVEFVELWVTPETTGAERVWRLAPSCLGSKFDGSGHATHWNAATETWDPPTFGLNRYADGDYAGNAPTSYVDEVRAYHGKQFVVITENDSVALPGASGSYTIVGTPGDRVQVAVLDTAFGAPYNTLDANGEYTVPSSTTGRKSLRVYRYESGRSDIYVPYRSYFDVLPDEAVRVDVPPLETASTTETSWHIMRDQGGTPAANAQICYLQLEGSIFDEIFNSWVDMGTTDENGRIDINAPNPGNDFDLLRNLWLVDETYGVYKLANSDLGAPYGSYEVQIGVNLAAGNAYPLVFQHPELPTDLPGYYDVEDTAVDPPTNIQTTEEYAPAANGWRTVSSLLYWQYILYVRTGEPDTYPVAVARTYTLKTNKGAELATGAATTLQAQLTGGAPFIVGGTISGVAWDHATPAADHRISDELGPEQLARMGAEHGELSPRVDQILELAIDGEAVQRFGSVDGTLCPRCGTPTWYRPSRTGVGDPVAFRHCADAACFENYGARIDASGWFRSYPVMAAVDADGVDVPWTVRQVRMSTHGFRCVDLAVHWPYPPRFDPAAAYDAEFTHFEVAAWTSQAFVDGSAGYAIPYYLSAYGVGAATPLLYRPKIYVQHAELGGTYDIDFVFADPDVTTTTARFTIEAGTGEETLGVGLGTVIDLTEVNINEGAMEWNEVNTVLLVADCIDIRLVSGGGAAEQFAVWADTPAVLFVAPPVRDELHTPYAVCLQYPPTTGGGGGGVAMLTLSNGIRWAAWVTGSNILVSRKSATPGTWDTATVVDSTGSYDAVSLTGDGRTFSLGARHGVTKALYEFYSNDGGQTWAGPYLVG